MSHPSQAQIEANRRNAKHGHGPNTPRGKGRSSQNAIRHGLTGRIVVLPAEDMEVYKAFSKELVDSLNPETPMECQLAQTIADTQWRLNRARTYEDGMIALGHFEDDGNFDGQSPEIHAALTAAKVFRERSKDFVNLSLYEQRLSRNQKEAFRQFRELQADRKAATPPTKEDSKPLTQAIGATATSTPAAVSEHRPELSGGQALSGPALDQRREAEASGFVYSDSEYDPGAFDPIYFKNSIPVQFIEVPVPTTEKKAA